MARERVRTVKVSRKEQQLLDASLRVRRQRVEARHDEWTAAARFGERQHRASRRFHEAIVQRAMEATGIDPKALARRHETERRAVMTFLDGRRRDALVDSVAANIRRNAELAERLRRWPALQPPSFVAARLDSATTITFAAGTGTTSIGSGQNIVKTKVERYGWVSGVQFDQRADLADVAWNFLWSPPRDGLLNVITFLVTNGLGVTYPGPGCVKGSSSYSLDASIELTQASTGGPPLSESSPPVRVAEERYDSSDHAAFGGGVIFTGTRLDDSTPVTFTNQFPVRANVPILVSVRALLYVLVSHGEAELNFKDRGFQLNVPFVHLMLF